MVKKKLRHNHAHSNVSKRIEWKWAWILIWEWWSARTIIKKIRWLFPLRFHWNGICKWLLFSKPLQFLCLSSYWCFAVVVGGGVFLLCIDYTSPAFLSSIHSQLIRTMIFLNSHFYHCTFIIFIDLRCHYDYFFVHIFGFIRVDSVI